MLIKQLALGCGVIAGRRRYLPNPDDADNRAQGDHDRNPGADHHRGDKVKATMIPNVRKRTTT